MSTLKRGKGVMQLLTLIILDQCSLTSSLHPHSEQPYSILQYFEQPQLWTSKPCTPIFVPRSILTLPSPSNTPTQLSDGPLTPRDYYVLITAFMSPTPKTYSYESYSTNTITQSQDTSDITVPWTWSDENSSGQISVTLLSLTWSLAPLVCVMINEIILSIHIHLPYPKDHSQIRPIKSLKSQINSSHYSPSLPSIWQCI